MRTITVIFLFLISGFVSRGQTISGGTAVVMVRTPSRVSLAVDSKEIQYHMDNGVLMKSETCASKAGRVADFVAVAAGFSRGSGGYDVLDTIAAQSEVGASFDLIINKSRREVAIRLQRLLRELWAAKIDIQHLHNPADPALQIGLIGIDNQVARTAVLEFFVDDPSGTLEPRSTLKQCPGDCGAQTYAYMLGTHSAIQSALISSPQIMRDLNLKRLEELIGAEEKANPEIVGGPIVTATGGLKGKIVLNSNGCTAPFTQPTQTAVLGASVTTGEAIAVGDSVKSLLDAQIVQVSELQCHKSIRRFVKGWRRYRQLDQIELDVEMHSGDEEYSHIQRKRESYKRIEDLPGSWSSGELATVIQVTRDAIASGRFESGDTGGEKSLSFSVNAIDHPWSLLVEGSRYWMNIRGNVQLRNGEIEKIEWTGTGLPAKSSIQEVALTIDFSETSVAGKPFRVPQHSEFRVMYLDPIVSPTLDTSIYTNYRRLGSTVNIDF